MKNFHQIPSVILAGDFNSKPESGVITFLKNGFLGKKHTDFQDQIWPGLLGNQIFNYAKFFQLKNCHEAVDKEIALKLSTKTQTFEALIDHLFYDENFFDLIGYLSDFDKSFKIYPNGEIPSDHIPVLVKLRFK